jgi:hypothetical protein
MRLLEMEYKVSMSASNISLGNIIFPRGYHYILLPVLAQSSQQISSYRFFEAHDDDIPSVTPHPYLVVRE